MIKTLSVVPTNIGRMAAESTSKKSLRGMVDTNLKPLGHSEISGILHKGGTIIGTSRTNPYKMDGGVDAVRKTFDQLDALAGQDFFRENCQRRHCEASQGGAQKGIQQ